MTPRAPYLFSIDSTCATISFMPKRPVNSKAVCQRDPDSRVRTCRRIGSGMVLQ